MTINRVKSPKEKKPQREKHHAIAQKTKLKRKKKNPNLIPLGNNPLLAEKKEKETKEEEERNNLVNISTISSSEQLKFFLHYFQSANGFKLCPLELEAFKDTCMVELSDSMDQDVDHFSEHVKAIFEASWKDVLCDGKLIKGKVDAGSPAVIVISTSALRSLELLRGLRPLTKECRPAKLFAKHMKVEEQLFIFHGPYFCHLFCYIAKRTCKYCMWDAKQNKEVNRYGYFVAFALASHSARHAKGCQGSEFWDVYRSHFSQRLVQGHTRISFYGSVPCAEIDKICQLVE